MSEAAAKETMARVQARRGAVRGCLLGCRFNAPHARVDRLTLSAANPANHARCLRAQGALDYGGFGQVDMVIEAAIEDVPLKQQIFADLERACRKCARVPCACGAALAEARAGVAWRGCVLAVARADLLARPLPCAGTPSWPPTPPPSASTSCLPRRTQRVRAGGGAAAGWMGPKWRLPGWQMTTAWVADLVGCLPRLCGPSSVAAARLTPPHPATPQTASWARTSSRPPT